MSIAGRLLRPFLGPGHLRGLVSTALQQQAHVDASFAALPPMLAASNAGETPPLFIFSAGWRSGSTLLQRMVSVNAPRLIWGEPYDKSMPVQSMAAQVAPFSAQWPPSHWYADRRLSDGKDAWVANLYPDLADFRDAHRAYFDTMFARPAARRGEAGWGLKEVRLDVRHARYLQWLYPSAKFVFLVRRPLDAFASYSGMLDWFEAWPDRPVSTARRFGMMWRRLANDYHANAARVGGLLVRYEDLEDRTDELTDYLGQEVVRPSRLERRKGKVAGVAVKRLRVEDRLILQWTTRRVRSLFGYR